jgi:hypothetical protein
MVRVGVLDEIRTAASVASSLLFLGPSLADKKCMFDRRLAGGERPTHMVAGPWSDSALLEAAADVCLTVHVLRSAEIGTRVRSRTSRYAGCVPATSLAKAGPR